MNIHYENITPENRDDARTIIKQIRIQLDARDIDHIEGLASEAGLEVTKWLVDVSGMKPPSISDLEQKRLDEVARRAMK